VYTGSEQAEGRLSLAEVQLLQLSTSRLVVMSACNTFKGALSKDGVLGISRAFLAAGAQSLVASLWPLLDEHTCSLIEEFYGALCEGLSVASALQRAMVKMIRAGYRVCVWAPFVLYGIDEVIM
jgi:CHAT domain-containing protein